MTQINVMGALVKDFSTNAKRGPAMFDQAALRDELQSLKADLSRLNTAGEEFLRNSKSRADAFADQVRTALGDVGEVLGQEDSPLERLITDRPIASIASAFALGIIVGIALRRH